MIDDKSPMRQAVERAAGFRLRDETWKYLIESGQVDTVLSGQKTMQSLVDEIRTLQRAFGPPVPVIGEAPAMLTSDWTGATGYSAREETLSRVVAERVADDEAVKAFRSDPVNDLPPELLRWEHVYEWLLLRQHANMLNKLGTAPTWWLDNVPVPDNEMRRIHRIIVNRAAATQFEGEPLQLTIPVEQARDHLHLRNLYYSIPGDPYLRWMEVRQGTSLAKLQELSARLASAITGWSEAQATIFILTGLPPLISVMQVGIEQNDAMPTLSRIVLHVDPALSPREVAERYRKVRQYLVGERHRDITEKHAQLALFSVTQLRDQPLAVRMGEWNKQHPEWAYSRESNFSRDSLLAQRRLLGVVTSSKQKVK